MTNRVNPLSSSVPIVDEFGRPTLEFMVKWDQQGVQNRQPIVGPGDSTQFLNGAAEPVFAHVKDSDLSLSDVTANNATTARHGFLPKLPGDSSVFLDGTGAFSTPAGGGGGGMPFSPPTISDFPTSINMSGVSVADTDAGIYFDATAALGGSARMFGRVQSVPGTDWTVTLGLIPYVPAIRTWAGVGLVLYNGTQVVFFGPAAGGGGGLHMYRARYNTPTSWNNDLFIDSRHPTGTPTFLRAARASGAVTWSYSYDGVSFDDLLTGESEFFTATTVGLGAVGWISDTSSLPRFCRSLCFYWEATAGTPAAIPRWAPSFGGWVP